VGFTSRISENHFSIRNYRSELFTIDEYLSFVQADLEQLRLAVIEILEHVGPETELVHPDVLFELIDLSFRENTIELDAGSTTALLASGDLSSIEEAELKSNLAPWPVRVSRIRNKSGLLEANRELIIDYLHDVFPTLDIVQRAGQMTRYPPSDFERDSALFQRNMRIEGLFSNRGMLIEDTEVHIDEVKHSIDEIIQRIDSTNG
jgi:hypothetical protein